MTSPERAKRRSPWYLLFGIAAAIAVGVFVLKAMNQPLEVEVGEVATGTLVTTINEDGRSRVKDRFTISAPVSGNLARLELRPGDSVTQGAVVARLVPAVAPLLDVRSRSQAEASVSAAQAGLMQARAQVERASAALDFARLEATRVESLVASGALNQAELDRVHLDKRTREADLTSAKFGVRVAGHQLSMAQAALGVADGTASSLPLTVTSPITGRVLRVIQQSEGVVQAGTQLIELGNPAALELVVDVLTSDAVSIVPGSAVQIENWGGPDLVGAVRLVEPSAFTRVSALGIDEQRVNAIVDLDEPYQKWKALGDGYRVEARIEVYRGVGAVLIPQSALFRYGQEWAAYEVSGGKAHRRALKIGRRNDVQAEVLEGLASGAEVIIHPSDQVQDRVAVSRKPTRRL